MSKHLTTSEFVEKAKLIHGDKYDYSKVEYINAKTPVEIFCPFHGYFWQTPDKHLQGHGCLVCSGKKHLTNEEFKKKAIEKADINLDFSESHYINWKTKVEVFCKKCGKYFYALPCNIYSGYGCPNCANRNMNNAKFIERAKLVHGDKYDYSLLNYHKAREKVKIICPTHGEFLVTPDNFLNKSSGCPYCNSSKGEELVAEILTALGIEFERQKKFSDLGNLSYDFYLTNKKILIEYNGIQHYSFSPYFHKGLHDFHKQKHHDWLKRKYAEKNDLKLLTISYKDIKILIQLREQLYKLNMFQVATPEIR